MPSRESESQLLESDFAQNLRHVKVLGATVILATMIQAPEWSQNIH